MAACPDCKHSAKLSIPNEPSMYVCRRFPPSSLAGFPKVSPTTLCGEYAVRVTPIITIRI